MGELFDCGPKMKENGLYRANFEHDNCGIGAVVNIKGVKTRRTVESALQIVENLEHRAGKDAEGATGDGVGMLLQVCHPFFNRVCREIGIELPGEGEYAVGMFFFPRADLSRLAERSRGPGNSGGAGPVLYAGDSAGLYGQA